MKIERCRCRCKAEINTAVPPFYVICQKDGGCWMGPDRKTKKKARKAWNKVMRARKAKR